MMSLVFLFFGFIDGFISKMAGIPELRMVGSR